MYCENQFMHKFRQFKKAQGHFLTNPAADVRRKHSLPS